MENAEIAGVFNEIADLLEIKGENPFRVRSYRNAAIVVEGWPESFKTLFEKGVENLEGIHGIGASIREKIIEMLTTGSCKFHDNILKEFPAGILDILKLSGVGPKKAALFFNKPSCHQPTGIVRQYGDFSFAIFVDTHIPQNLF